MGELKRVLYVEDDPDIREIASLALQDVGGLEILICESGKTALSTIDEFSPQLILLDVMMPEMDGPETLLALRAQGSVTETTIVAFMTAKVHPEELSRYKQLGITEVISKPFNPMTLADELRTIWKRFDD